MATEPRRPAPRHSRAGPAEQDQRGQQRRALRAMILPLFFVIGFSLCYISAFHAPVPHGVKVAVAGPAQQTAPLRAGLARAAGSAFAVTAVPTAAGAERQVHDGDLDGAYVPAAPPATPRRARVARPQPTATAIVNSALGPQIATVVEPLAQGAAAKQGARLAVRDVRPLPPGDRDGSAVFYYMIVCTLATFLTVHLLGSAAPALNPLRRYLLILAAAVGGPVLAYLIGGPLIGAYTGPAGTVFALIELGVLYAFAVGVIARGLQVLLGRVAIFVMMTVFILLNFPSAGGAVPGVLLPAFWRFLNRFWIGASALGGFRSILYLGGHGVANDLDKLLAWFGVGLALVVASFLWKRARRRPAAASAAGSAGQVTGEPPEAGAGLIEGPAAGKPAADAMPPGRGFAGAMPAGRDTGSPGGPAAMVSGTVTDAGGTPVPGATITVIGTDGRELRRTSAEGDGHYAVDGLPEDSVTVLLSSPGWTPDAARVRPAAGQPVRHDFVLQPRQATPGSG